VRNAIVFLVFLSWPVSLPGAASAGQMTLYGAFDSTHNGAYGRAAAPHAASPPPVASSDVLAGCGRGRYRDSATQRCRGPADLR
jgi:hypothetical protein